jgi:hypothetical protein
MASDDYLCIHLVDTRYSRCGLCLDRKPHGLSADPRIKQAVAGPERQAAEWQPTWAGALSSIPRTDHDWGELASRLGDGATLGPWVDARFYGTCTGCGFRWEPGDMIRKDEEQDAWICSACGSEE